MNIAEYTIKKTVLSVIVMLLAIFGGWSAYKTMPRFEDPEFTIRTAQIIIQYPGASPLEVAEEVTEPMERAIQQMQEVDAIESTSSKGVSEIKVDIKFEFSPSKDSLQVIWTKLRNKVKDAEAFMPPGASTAVVYDDFGDVYGLYYFLTGDGYSPSELRKYGKELQGELLRVEGVAKVVLAGESREAIFIEVSRENAASLGVSLSSVYNILSAQNSVTSAGDLAVGDLRVAIDPSGAIGSVDAIENLLVAGSGDGPLIYLKDIARVWRGYQTPPDKIFRYNRQRALALGVSSVSGANVVKVGKAISDKIAESESRRPVGFEVHKFYHQGDIVETAVENFVVNVIVALIIVVITLFVFMGLRSAIVIGAILLLTILATLATMNMSGIPMHRISLGALIIALGMMVDNAIVVTEGILVGVQRGRKKLDIAKAIVNQTIWPLLGGSLVGIVAFAPIGFAPGSTAEYTGHLFRVILISLMYSWLFAITLTPLLCFWLFKETGSAVSAKATQDSWLIQRYRLLIRLLLGKRTFTVAAVVALFALSLWGFRFVKPGFFPASTTPQLVIDYWLPQGTDIARTGKDIREIEAFIAELQGVNAVQTSIGAGGLRFMLVYGPESPNSSYAQILARVDDYKALDGMMPIIQDYIDRRFPDGQAKLWRFKLGPGGGAKIEATFKGASPAMLRKLANQAKAKMIEDGGALSIKDNWRQQVQVIEPIYSERKGRRAGVSIEDLATALQINFSGKPVGVYREGDDLIPIISRAPSSERQNIEDIKNIQVLSSVTGQTVPIGQVTDGFRTVWRDGLLRRKDRSWTIKAQADPLPGVLTSDLQSRLMSSIGAIQLPDGYTLEWDGEYGDSKESNDSLASTIPFGFLTMALIVFVLFGTVRQPVVIWLVVPLALIGVVLGLIVTGTPLEFMGILGLLSLSGLLIKNGIVLVDQIDFEIKSGTPRYDALVEAASSRLRPVMMGTLTTVLGVIPLFFDAFFQSMSVVLVFGLSFATVLTLLLVPVLYAIFFGIRSEETKNEH